MQKIYALFLSLSFVVLYGATKTVEHTIENGETIYTIAQKYHTTMAEVREKNSLVKGEMLKLGRVLIVPTNTYFDGMLGYGIESGDTLLSLAGRFNTSVAEIKAVNKLTEKTILNLGQIIKIPKSKKSVQKETTKKNVPQIAKQVTTKNIVKHTILSGDTLLALSQKYRTTVKEIKTLNAMNAHPILNLGDVLSIPQNTYIRNAEEKSTEAKVAKIKADLKKRGIESVAYRIQQADSLLALSQTYQTTVQEIKTLNELEKNQILKLGQLLVIAKNTYIRATNEKTPVIASITSKTTPKPKKVKKVKRIPVVLTKLKSIRRKSNEFVEYSIAKGDTLFTIARKHHTTMDEIKEMNKLKKREILSLGRILNVPKNTYYSNLVAYSIQKGDNLFKIARKHHTTIKEVREVNKMKVGEQLKLGRVLKVPQNTYNPNAPKVETITIVAKTPKKSFPKVRTYTIVKGDTLFTIARKHKVTITELREANKMKRGARLKIGRVLTLKASKFNARNSKLAKKKRAKTLRLVKKSKKRKYKRLVNKHVVTNAKRVKVNKSKKRKKYELGDIFYSHLNKKQKSTRKSTKIISLAKTKLGRRYVWGATGGRNTFDCSGLTTYVYKKNGIKLPRRAIAQSRVGKRISRKNLRKGDLIFFDTSRRRKGYVNHVGIYIGNNKFIHASSAKKKVVITSLSKPFYSQRFRGGRRM